MGSFRGTGDCQGVPRELLYFSIVSFVVRYMCYFTLDPSFFLLFDLRVEIDD